MNWQYGGTSNITYNLANGGFPFSWTVNGSTDTAQSSNTRYVAKFGNDVSGNGSRISPFNTIARALQDVTGGNTWNIIIGNGEYFEGGLTLSGAFNTYVNFVADGIAVINGAQLFNQFLTMSITASTNAATQANVTCSNITFRNFLISGVLINSSANTAYTRGFGFWRTQFIDIPQPFLHTATGAATEATIFYTSNLFFMQECVVNNANSWLPVYQSTTGNTAITVTANSISRNTFYKCARLKITEAAVTTFMGNCFAFCNIILEGNFFSSYNSYFGCRFKRGRSTVSTAFGSTNVTDANGTFDLGAFATPAQIAASYSAWGNLTLGTYSVTYNSGSPTVTVTGVGGTTQFVAGWRLYTSAMVLIGTIQSVSGTSPSAQTITLVANSPVSGASDTAILYSVPSANASQVPLPFISAFTPTVNPRFNNQAFTTISAGTNVLNEGAEYVVEGNSIVYNSTTYIIGSIFSVVIGGDRTFSGSGTCREVFPWRDLSLNPVSPIRTGTFYGQPIGARFTGKRLPALTVFNGTNWVLNTAANIVFTNCIIDPNNVYGVIPDPANGNNATIVFPVEDLGQVREIESTRAHGEQAFRDGESFDNTPNLANTTVSSGGIVANRHYLVETAPIVYDFGGSVGSRVLSVGDRFSPVTATNYTGSGVCREILEAPNRLTFRMRYSSASFANNVADTNTALDSWNATRGTNWKMFWLAQKPFVDTDGYGNGNLLFTAANGLAVLTRYVQVEITILRLLNLRS